MDDKNFPVPVGDWIVVDKIDIKDKYQQTAEKAKIELIGGMTPKSIQEIENQRRNEQMTYQESREKMLARWPAHPNQGIVKAVGPDVKIDVRVGNQIMLRGSVGEPMIWKKNLYWMHKPHEVFAIVN